MAANWFSAPAPVARRVRGYFAPVNRATQTPVLFDPAEQGGFSLDAPPAPWISLGWIQEFARKPASKTSPVLTGIPAGDAGAGARDARGAGELRVSELDKADHGAGHGLAAHESAGSGKRGCRRRRMERRRLPAVTPQSGSTATFVALAATDAAKFSRRLDRCAGRGLHRADGLCGLAGRRRLCAPGADRCGLHPARDLQRCVGLAGKLRPGLPLPSRCRAARRRRAPSYRR